MITFNPDLNFWELNPELKYPEEFAKLYNEDKSKKKVESSKIMNAIYLLLHKDSRYYDLPEKERRTLIIKDYLKLEDFRWEDYKEQQDAFLKYTTSKARRLLRTWELKLEERDEFISSIRYDADTAKMLDDMMASTEKIWKQYMSLLQEVEKEEATGSVQGGAIESLTEQGRI